jgi:peptide-methionine (S)-S-oxide reductase
MATTPIPRRALLFLPGALLAAGVVAFAVAAPQRPLKLDVVHRLPPPAVASPAPASGAQSETVVLSGGCFWGVQGVFAHVKGVLRAESGYAGGPGAAAHYELVSTGLTGHAESVKVVFDPRRISLGRILQIFFSVATDPTQLNHQFPDDGPQYRSEVFYTTPAQAALARAYVAELDRAGEFSHPIVTRIDPLPAFYPAEAYHQDYLTLHPDQPYIASYDLPKVAALKALFPEDFRPDPVLVFGKG